MKPVLYFITGAQSLYGEDALREVARDSEIMASYLNGALEESGVGILRTETAITHESAEAICRQAEQNPACVGVIFWMHTFSPAKMWIGALQSLRKPIAHLHTQCNEKLPYDSIDMDFMNLNQSAHGDREFGFLCTRMGVRREVIAGYYRSEAVVGRLRKFARAALALEYSRHLRVAMLGSNMRNVAVTDGDRVESELRLGWNVNYYGIGDVAERINAVSEAEIDAQLRAYTEKYTLATDRLDAVREQAKIEVALRHFLADTGAGALTDTFEDLHGLKQLPGLAAQNLMADGIGFGPEGDYKTAALSAVLMKMAGGRGATGFTEDYTYDLSAGAECELAAHMLEVSPAFARSKPEIQVHPLGIGGKEDPARLVFDGVAGEGIAVSMVDLGDRFRLVCAEIELIEQPHPMPHLPVARLMWRLKPDFSTGAAGWIYAGGAHHAVVSTALDVEDIRLLAKFTGCELVVIDAHTTLASLERELALLDALARLR